jgi:SulP family sulfate permease
MKLLANIKGDIYGGVTAAVVALPLALAFGVASGAGPLAGLWGAILVGFFASLFGGTPSQVSGPTGPMTVIMASIVMQYAHEPTLAFAVVILAGVLQILFGMFRLGNLITLVPYTVISGFMSGIGCIIIILQLAPLLGQSIPEGGTVGALMALPNILRNTNTDAFIVGGIALLLMMLSPARLNRILPAPLLALIIGTVAVVYFFHNAPVIGNIPTGIPAIHFPNISFSDFKDMLGSALVLALLGSIDSLLTSLIADSMTHSQHNSNKELVGQGIGNTIAGLFAAIPGAGATMRTVINIRAGGETSLSGMIHSLVLLSIVLGFSSLAEKIPHAVLAGILIKVGWDIIDWDYLKQIHVAPKKGVIHMSLVLVLTVFVDLIVAVGTGLVVASLTFVKNMSELQLDNVKRVNPIDNDEDNLQLSQLARKNLEELSDSLVMYRFEGPMSFGVAKRIFTKLNEEDDAKIILLDFSKVTYLDTSAALTLKESINSMLENNKRVMISGVCSSVRNAFNSLLVIASIPDSEVFSTREQALLELGSNNSKQQNPEQN